MSRPKPVPSNDRQPALDLGTQGETLVAQWWRDRGGLILYHRWHCRWGELDLVIGQPQPQHPSEPASLVFVEVKTRSRGNWDANGALAITTRKQAKLWKTAQVFLSQHPNWGELPCQFDVALVSCGWGKEPAIARQRLSNQDSLLATDYQLVLQHYITSAFTLS